MIMKYLVYFRPNKELSDLILRQSNIIMTSLGLHSTLYVFHMESEQENNLVTDLSKIKFNPFEIETLGFDNFDENSLVLKLSRPDELLQLHKKIIPVVKNYTNEDFEGVERQYFGDNYSPHLTISKSSYFSADTLKELIGRKDIIAKYYLAKKIDGVWKEIILKII